MKGFQILVKNMGSKEDNIGLFDTTDKCEFSGTKVWAQIFWIYEGDRRNLIWETDVLKFCRMIQFGRSWSSSNLKYLIQVQILAYKWVTSGREEASVESFRLIRYKGSLKSKCSFCSAEVRLRADVSHVASGSLYKCVKTLHLLGYRPTQINKGSRFEGMHLKNTVL